MMPISSRWTAILAGLAGILGVLMIGESFHLNNGPALTAPDSTFLAYAISNRQRVLWGAWLQAAGPALIIVLAITLVALSKATARVSGLLTLFGAGVLMTTSLMEIACYIAGLFPNPPELPRIANTFGYAIQHLYFFVAAPSLFLSLGCVLLGSTVLPKLFAWLALLLGATFLVLGLLHIDDLVLPWPVTAFAAVQALWWFLAGVVLIFRSGRIARDLG
jgi:hypothetical protein